MNKHTFLFSKMMMLLLMACNGYVVFAGDRNDSIYSISDFGAVGDGKTLNTEAINRTIAFCAGKGGGTVQVPAGNFVTGTIVLQSNVTLWLHQEAHIIGAADLSQYVTAKLGPEDPVHPINITVDDSTAWMRSLVLIANVHNVAINGTGIIDGGSLIDKNGEEGHRGPHGIFILYAQNISISGIRVARSGNYNIIGLHVADCRFTGVTISQGADGIHIRDGKNLLIYNCKFYTADDAIAGGYWQNVLIKDCLINSSCNGIRVILPATNLEIKDCEIFGPGVFGHARGTITNRLVTQTLTGIIVQPGAWGAGPGRLDNIYIHQIRIRDAQTAFTFVLNEGNQSNKIRVENIVATGITKNACSFEGWPVNSFYENVQLKNIEVSYALNDTGLIKTANFERPRTESRPLPFWGFYAKNVKNISFENIHLNYAGKEERPVMEFEKVDKVSMKNVHYKKVANVKPFNYQKSTAVTLIDTGSFN